MCHPICGVRGQRHIYKCYGKNPLASPINDRVLDNWPQAASITSKTFLSCFIRCMCPPHLPGTSCARCKLGIRHGPSFLGASRLMRKGRDLQKGKIRRTYDLVTELWVIWTLENKPWLCACQCLCFSFPCCKAEPGLGWGQDEQWPQIQI